MGTMLYELWHGRLKPRENCGDHREEANHLLELMERNRKKLDSGLTPEFHL